MKRYRRFGGAALVGLPILACGTAPPTPAVQLDPVIVERPEPSPLAPVAFLAGCWRGTFMDGSTLIVEQWAYSSDVMLGTTRFMRDGVTVEFEFGHVAATSGGIVYTPYPGGERSPHGFRLTSHEPGVAVFEAPEHDYPKRILYSTGPEGGMEVQIDAGAEDPEPRRWDLAPTPCEGLPAI